MNDTAPRVSLCGARKLEDANLMMIQAGLTQGNSRVVIDVLAVEGWWMGITLMLVKTFSSLSVVHRNVLN